MRLGQRKLPFSFYPGSFSYFIRYKKQISYFQCYAPVIGLSVELCNLHEQCLTAENTEVREENTTPSLRTFAPLAVKK